MASHQLAPRTSRSCSYIDFRAGHGSAKRRLMLGLLAPSKHHRMQVNNIRVCFCDRFPGQEAGSDAVKRRRLNDRRCD